MSTWGHTAHRGTILCRFEEETPDHNERWRIIVFLCGVLTDLDLVELHFFLYKTESKPRSAYE